MKAIHELATSDNARPGCVQLKLDQEPSAPHVLGQLKAVKESIIKLVQAEYIRYQKEQEPSEDESEATDALKSKFMNFVLVDFLTWPTRGPLPRRMTGPIRRRTPARTPSEDLPP